MRCDMARGGYVKREYTTKIIMVCFSFVADFFTQAEPGQ